MAKPRSDVLDSFRPAVADWFRASFDAPTRAQELGWPVMRKGGSMLLLAPTGSGKTLTAFLSCIDRLMFSPVPDKKRRCRVLYVSPLKALAVDVERNLRSPLTGIANVARGRDETFHLPAIAIRTGDTPPEDRARFQRTPADILITTPESLYLLLTSNAREALRTIETVIVDEIHSLVGTKRGAHLALSLERLESIAAGPIQRVGLSATRPAEFGRRIGALARELGSVSEAKARVRLERDHGLDALAATNLMQYLADQRDATGTVPDDRTVVVERVRDELGDWLACVLPPLGGRVMAPWAMAVVARIRRESSLDVEAMWGDDGFIIRFPETDEPPAVESLLPTPDELESLLIRQLAGTSVFASKFRESAGRALLLPKRFGQERRPLWQQRKRAWDLMQVASRFGSFPIFLETYRECLRDVFDLPELLATLKKIESREIRVSVADTDRLSPFSGSLLFRYVANFLYDGDAPLAERRAQALAIDQSQLRELLGEAELRELLDSDAIEEIERSLGRTIEGERARTADGVHDLLLSLGDLSATELRERCESKKVADSIRDLVGSCRALELQIGGERRFIAAEDAARYRDAIGVPLPGGIPDAFLRKVDEPMRDLSLRFARSRGPFMAEDLATRFGIPRQYAEQSLHALVREGKVIEGEFRPEGTRREFCHAEVLRRIRRLSLARLRKEVEPVEPRAFARFLAQWQGGERAAPGAWCARRRHRAAPGRAFGGLDSRVGDPARTGCGVCPERSRPAHCLGRGRLDRRRSSRRARR